MLARVSGGQKGIVQYLENGVKSGRELNRDELDQRVTIDGNIKITDTLINKMAAEDGKKNYLHITLSFGEKELKEETIIDAYNDYKNSVMSAYSKDEFNVYAEIHYPKVKSYKNKKTGETVERFPHVHIVIPQKNLLSDKALDPFGLYQSNIKYHDAIQETVNRKYGLESPYDNQRKYKLTDNSDFISRYKGDTFKGSNRQFKNEIFDLIGTKNIRSMEDFKKELSQHGEVSTGKNGSIDEYLQVKLPGSIKNIRLKEDAFKKSYINERVLEREKPSDKEIGKNLNDWVTTRSHEMKHIHTASPKVRKEYSELTKDKQTEYLNERRDDFTRRYNTGNTASKNDIRPRRRETNREFSITGNGGRTFTQISNGLPDLSQRSLAGTNNQRHKTAESLLPSNEHDNLEPGRTDRNNQLRRTIDRRGGGRGLDGQSSSVPEQLSKQHQNSQMVKNQQELGQYREIRNKIDPKRVLNHFAKSQGLISSNYRTFKARDGSPRIKIGDRAYNVSDFITKHMHKDWSEAKDILKTIYHTQLEADRKNIRSASFGVKQFKQQTSGLPQKTLFNKRGKDPINSIVFSSNLVTNSFRKPTVESDLNRSVQIFKYLKIKEIHEDKTMHVKEDKNTISSGQISLKETTDNFKRQVELAKQLTAKMSDLVAAKNVEKRQVDFIDKETGKSVFQDKGTHVEMSERKPTLDQVGLAMSFAAEKFGKVQINGTDEFKQQAVQVAIAKNLNVVFADKNLHEQFVKERENFNKKQNSNVDISENQTKQTPKDQTLPTEAKKEKEQTQADPQKNEKKSENKVDMKQYHVTYDWDERSKKMEVKINGKSPQEIPEKVLTAINQNDKFLKGYSLDNIRDGKLDLSVSKNQPVSKIYNSQGEALKPVENTQTTKQTQ